MVVLKGHLILLHCFRTSKETAQCCLSTVINLPTKSYFAAKDFWLREGYGASARVLHVPFTQPGKTQA